MLGDLAPGAAGDLITEALQPGQRGARQENGEVALAARRRRDAGRRHDAFGQLERGANRIYGVERDRPPLRKYGTAPR